MAREITAPLPPGLGKILSEGSFSVPSHQRDYSWRQDEVSLLLDDVETALARGDTQYFVGLMVFLGSDDTNTLIVLDGQQRLATAIIFFSAIRDWLRQYTEFEQFQDDARKIQEWFIGRSDFGETKPSPRLILNAANHQTFLKHVVYGVPYSDIESARNKLKRFDRNRRLLGATIYCHDRVKQFASNAGVEKAHAHFVGLLTYFRDAVSVVRLDVSDEDTAFTIFETLNDRGLELSPLDLVKNYLFSQATKTSRGTARPPAQEQLRDMEERWVQMMQTLNNVRADAFIKAFWTSRHGRVQASNLFGQFKRQYGGSDKAVAVSIDMLEVSEQYAGLENPDDATWSGYSQQSKEIVRALKLLGAQQMHPVMLAALKRFDAAEMQKLLRLLEAIIVRYQLIGGGRTGRLEIVCARVAKAICVGKTDGPDERPVKKTADVFRECREIYPSDETFEPQFAIASERNEQKAAYLLKHLEIERRRRDRDKNPGELIPGSLTVEHILPKNPGNTWESILKADRTLREDCTYRLGNMCLLTERMNRGAARSGFEEKKEIYGRSELGITNKINDTHSWNRTTIEDRQKYMAKMAPTIWQFQ
jgi:hypothetical protein